MAPSSLNGYWIHRPVPVIRNAGTAYAERRYQLGAVLTRGVDAGDSVEIRVQTAGITMVFDDSFADKTLVDTSKRGHRFCG